MFYMSTEHKKQSRAFRQQFVCGKIEIFAKVGGCCKKREKKLTCLIFKEGILIRDYQRNPRKKVPMLYNNDFWRN